MRVGNGSSCQREQLYLEMYPVVVPSRATSRIKLELTRLRDDTQIYLGVRVSVATHLSSDVPGRSGQECHSRYASRRSFSQERNKMCVARR